MDHLIEALEAYVVALRDNDTDRGVVTARQRAWDAAYRDAPDIDRRGALIYLAASAKAWERMAVAS